MIQQGTWTLAVPGCPALAAVYRAMLPCGCANYVGVRVDTQEPATGAAACSPTHEHLMRHAVLLLQESLTEPSDRLLIAVVDEKLREAARAHGVHA